jgi:hypothetical protein
MLTRVLIVVLFPFHYNSPRSLQTQAFNRSTGTASDAVDIQVAQALVRVLGDAKCEAHAA